MEFAEEGPICMCERAGHCSSDLSTQDPDTGGQQVQEQPGYMLTQGRGSAPGMTGVCVLGNTTVAA